MFKENKQSVLHLIKILGLVIFYSLVIYSILLYKDKTVFYTQEVGQEKNYTLPLRIKIPVISVEASVESVGVTPDGEMDAPEGPSNAGWYNLGPKPGEKGSAVMDGHSGWKDDIPAVFDNLHKLKKGDEIYIENTEGVTLIFVVREIRKYNPNADTKEVFFSNDSEAHLNLITCEGIWNEVTKSRSERLVVFTDLLRD